MSMNCSIGRKPWRWLAGAAALAMVAQLAGFLGAGEASALTRRVSIPSVLPFVGLNHPDDVVFDNSDDNTSGALFVADTNNNRVVELYDGHQSTLPFVGLNQPRGVALVYSEDEDCLLAVVVADTNNNRVVVLPWNGSLWGTQYTLGTVGLNAPSGVTTATYGGNEEAPNNNLEEEYSVAFFISDTNNSRVVEYLQTPEGDSQSTVPMTGLNHPWGVALAGGFRNPSTFGLLVSDTNNNRLVYFDQGAQYLVPASGLNQPTGLSQSVDNCGNEFVADTNNNRVLAESGSAGGQAIMPFSGLNQPNGTDAGDGYVFAADSNNSRIVATANNLTCQPKAGPFQA